MGVTRCKICREPITSAYVPLIFGKAHEACYRGRYGPRCNVCGLVLAGPCVVHQGLEVHEECYLAELAPRCKACGERIREPKWLVHEGKPVHDACFKRHIAERCDVCGGPLVGQYLTDGWGHRFHERHRTDFPPCDACGRLTCAEISGGGVALGDGRVLCRTCLPSAVPSEAEAAQAYGRVRQFLEHQGLDLPPEHVPLVLVNRPELLRLMARSGHPSRKDVYGCTLSQQVVVGNKVTQRDATIYILRSLPRALFCGVAGHELGHAWEFLAGCPAHVHALSEGFCNYLRFLVHKADGGAENEFYIETMMRDENAAYGEGFRVVRSYAENRGFAALLRHLRKSGDFPLLGWKPGKLRS